MRVGDEIPNVRSERMGGSLDTFIPDAFRGAFELYAWFVKTGNGAVYYHIRATDGINSLLYIASISTRALTVRTTLLMEIIG